MEQLCCGEASRWAWSHRGCGSISTSIELHWQPLKAGSLRQASWLRGAREQRARCWLLPHGGECICRCSEHPCLGYMWFRFAISVKALLAGLTTNLTLLLKLLFWKHLWCLLVALDLCTGARGLLLLWSVSVSCRCVLMLVILLRNNMRWEDQLWWILHVAHEALAYGWLHLNFVRREAASWLKQLGLAKSLMGEKESIKELVWAARRLFHCVTLCVKGSLSRSCRLYRLLGI